MRVNLRAVAGTLGALLMALGGSLLVPAAVDLYYGEDTWWAFVGVAVASAAVGGGLYAVFRPRGESDIGLREGFVIVTVAWFLLSLVGALPFVLLGWLGPTDAVFETASGFTTSGLSILGGAATPQIEELPKSLLLWRSLAHWLGGMGFIVLALAILPLLGVGGMQLFKAEVSGPAVDKLTPRVADTAKRLWVIYVGLTLLGILLLLPAMDLFDAVNHGLAAISTGGFSTRNGSVGDFQSAYVDWVIIAFMIIGATSFALLYIALRGKLARFWQSDEFRYFIGIMLAATVVLCAVLWPASGDLLVGELDPGVLQYESLHDAVRTAAFQAVSIVTATGFATSDYVMWPTLGVVVMFALFFTGGMAGSTAGGIKIIRIALLGKNAVRDLKRLLHPQAVLPIRFGGRVVPEEVMRMVLSFVVLYLGLVLLGTIVLGAVGVDLVTALGSAASAIGNIGPAFGTAGPAANYAHIPATGKWVLTFLMVAGRLEIFTLLVLLSPGFWRR